MSTSSASVTGVSSSNPIIPSPEKLPSSFNVSTMFNTPMDRATYTCWQTQFEMLLSVHRLSSFITDDPPPQVLPDGSPNPVFPDWEIADKLVRSWINATAPVQQFLVHCKSAKEAWLTLERRMCPSSRIHTRTLREKLRAVKKTPEKTMLAYLDEAKAYAEALRGTDMAEDELIDYILDGLGPEFKTFKTSILTLSALSFDDLQE
jgi:hypothetical protein